MVGGINAGGVRESQNAEIIVANNISTFELNKEWKSEEINQLWEILSIVRAREAASAK